MANSNVFLAVQLNDAGAVNRQPMDATEIAASALKPVGSDLQFHAE